MKISRYGPPRPQGFALVATLSILVLLLLVVIGLLSLSTITIRTSSQERAEAEARANARLALILAIGELQKQAGTDTRVTAPADILEEENPPLLGVWRSWEGSNHETGGTFEGRPTPPDYDSKEKSTEDGGRFLAWLVSSAGIEPDPGEASTLVDRAASPDTVALLSMGTLGEDDDREVHVDPTEIENSGGIAWWISGENQKVLVPKPYKPKNDTAARWAVIAKSHSAADPEPFGLDVLLNDPAPADKAITRASADLIGEHPDSKPHEAFHDLSAQAVGLLTNTATGGWRKDLSILTENWEDQSKSGLPFFRLTSTKSTQATIPTVSNAVPAGSALYPWAGYRGGQTIPIYQHAAVTSWANLFDYATHYKRISASNNGRITTPIHSENISGGQNFSFLHKVRILPIIARMQWVFSHSAGRLTGANNGKFEPRLLLTPVITMWNPYSAEITSPQSLDFIIPKPLPVALQYTLNGAKNPIYNAVMSGLTNQPALGGSSIRFRIDQAFTLQPGETRLFSPSSNSPVSQGTTITLTPGYRSGGGHYFQVKGSNGQVQALPGSASIKADAKFDTVYGDRRNGVGIYLDMTAPGKGRQLVYRMVYAPEVANDVYPPLKNLAAGTLSQCATNPQPFLSTIFGARTASNTHLAAKGFVQSSPLVNYTAMGFKDEAESTISRHYTGTGHPVNSPFDYSFVKHAPGGDSQLPNASDSTGRGYIVTGFNKSDGLSRCVIAELPVRPLASLGELTNWDLRYENPIPPFAINLIGNSDASPLLPSSAVYNSRDASLKENLQYDDSYCANHLLFDDWFFSSIAPDPDNFGTSGRTQKEVYGDWVKGEDPLANRAYRPIRADAATAAEDGGSALFNKHVKPREAWKTLASRLEVEGMFNVNSTSLKAWRALLGHARGHRVPYIGPSGNNWKVELSDESDHVMSRFTISGDTEAGTAGSSGAFPEATEFSGYRTVDDSFLDALAEEVVVQIRQRGPFLSLAEFVNRQLSDEYGDLALAGTLQAALNELSKNPATDPFADLKALSTNATANPPNPAGVAYDEEYQFPDAGVGHSGYGLPGWTRQADILRPLAPILSARDDTFTIRAYGDARGKDGRLLARAWCEAVVRRTREFFDPADAADLFNAPTQPLNRIFGRRFDLISFRWLAADEV